MFENINWVLVLLPALVVFTLTILVTLTIKLWYRALTEKQQILLRPFLKKARAAFVLAWLFIWRGEHMVAVLLFVIYPLAAYHVTGLWGILLFLTGGCVFVISLLGIAICREDNNLIWKRVWWTTLWCDLYFLVPLFLVHAKGDPRITMTRDETLLTRLEALVENPITVGGIYLIFFGIIPLLLLRRTWRNRLELALYVEEKAEEWKEASKKRRATNAVRKLIEEYPTKHEVAIAEFMINRGVPTATEEFERASC